MHVLELAQGDAGGAKRPSRAQLDVRTTREADLGPLVDRQAAAAYRRRLAELDDEISEAEADADLDRATKLRWEKDALLSELRSGFGLGGRARTASGATERARKAVAARMRDAVDRIAGVHPELGRHLRASVRTGTYCRYDPERPVRWTV